MKDYSFSISAHNLMTYFVKQNHLYFIVNKSDIREVVERAYEFAHPNKRTIDSEIESSLKLLYFGIIKQDKDKNLSKFFIDNYLASSCYKKNAFIAIKNFGEVNVEYECKLLIDFLFCICENNRNIDATINYKADTDSATLQMMRKNPNSYGMLFDVRLPLVELEGYVANHLGILMKLRDGSFIKYGVAIEEAIYEKYQVAYEFDTNKFLYKV